MEKDWGEISSVFEDIFQFAKDKKVKSINEASTRFHIIDRFIKEILNWDDKSIEVEYRTENSNEYADYIVKSGDESILIEAKRIGSVFPDITKKKKLKIQGSVLGTGEIKNAIDQAINYAQKIKDIDIIIVTNGICWCYFNYKSLDDNSFADILFPFDDLADAKELFDMFSIWSIEKGSLKEIKNAPLIIENRLVDKIRYLDGRIDRNNIADYISVALNYALHADSLLQSEETMNKCFVKTDNRTRYDKTLKIFLTDYKPQLGEPVKRLKKYKTPNELHNILEKGLGSFTPPITLLIGFVGVGKTTFLHYFRTISGKELIEKGKIHWIYIDFSKLGKTGNPREFLYRSLRDYLSNDDNITPTDYKNLINPSYENITNKLIKGHLAPYAKNPENLKLKVADYIQNDYDSIEPFVDIVFKYLCDKFKCVIVLDNIDLYENAELETTVFSEGLALTKKIKANVIVSIRDKTFVKHRTDSVFDAYELRNLWLDPPPFKEVLSKRLIFSETLLKNKSAEIVTTGGIRFKVHDMSQFFDIVQRSVLQGDAGNFIDYIADLDIRKGLNLINYFLTSGHIHADTILKSYLYDGRLNARFPFHEIFKGTMLSHWKHFKEERSDCANIFDSRLGSEKLRLLRLYILRYLYLNSNENISTEVSINNLLNIFKHIGATEYHIILTTQFLYKKGLIRNVTSEDIDENSYITISRSGAYYISFLTKTLIYVEECMFDTSIDNIKLFHRLEELTDEIEIEYDKIKSMNRKLYRVRLFLSYLKFIENVLETSGLPKNLLFVDKITEAVNEEVRKIIIKLKSYKYTRSY